MKNYFSRILSLVFLGLVSPALLMAQVPEYDGNAFDQVQILADDGMLFFGVIIAAAVIVVGFWKGRQWFRKI
ncbi:MAG: hypothetical protein JNG83_02895 [Opitutaceae bacterium]|nr:hypothetical protein [Opitutaceae bacterium]